MPLSNAERQKRSRERQKARVAVLEQAVKAGDARPSLDAVAAARKIQDAREASSAAAPRWQALREAVQVGRWCGIWEEVAAGHTAAEEELAAWIAADPPLLWLFLSWVAEESGSADIFDEWCSERGLLPDAVVGTG